MNRIFADKSNAIMKNGYSYQYLGTPFNTIYCDKLLVAMSRSRSVFVCSCLRPFFSFSVLGVLSSPKQFQWCFNKALRVFEVLRMFPINFNGVYKNIKEVKRVLKRSFKSVLRKFQGKIKGISRKFQRYFK